MNAKLVSTTQDSGNQAMTKLSTQWYNTLVTGLKLDPNQFQLLQPAAPLGATSDALWAYFNNLPPASLVNNLDVSGGNRFYEDYQAVVSQLRSQQGDLFRTDLGDSYTDWMAYVKTLSPAPALKDLPNVFRNWAAINAPDVAQKGTNDLRAWANDPILLAQDAVTNQSGFKNGIPNFSRTIADLRVAIGQAPGSSIGFDSSTASSDASKTWAGGTVSGAYDIFFGGASASYSTESAKATSSRIVVSANFSNALTFATGPGSWYSSAALAMAYATKDNTLWNLGTPSWDSTFGPKGNMLRFVASLIVVDGIDMTITSDAQFSTSEQTNIKASLSVGVWPFFRADASGGYSSQASFSSSGAMTIRTTSPKGNPVVLGANVVSVSQFVGG